MCVHVWKALGKSIRELDSFIAKIDQRLTLIAVRVILAGAAHGRQEKCWCSVQICILRLPRGTRQRRALTWLPAVCTTPPITTALATIKLMALNLVPTFNACFYWAIKIMCTLSQSVGGSTYLPPSVITHSDIQMSRYKNELLLRMSPGWHFIEPLQRRLYNADAFIFTACAGFKLPFQTNRHLLMISIIVVVCSNQAFFGKLFNAVRI